MVIVLDGKEDKDTGSLGFKIDNYYKGYDCKEAACGGGQLLLGLDFAEKVEGFQHPISYTNYYIN